MSTTITNRYQFLEAGAAHPRVTSFLFARLGVTETELLETGARCGEFYARHGRAHADAVAMVGTLNGLYADAASHVASLTKSVRAADTAEWANDANVFAPTHSARCANLFARAASAILDTFVSFHTGAANVGRPADLDVRLSVLTAFAPLLTNEADTAVWEFSASTYAAARAAAKRALESIGVTVNRHTMRFSFDTDTQSLLAERVG